VQFFDPPARYPSDRRARTHTHTHHRRFRAAFQSVEHIAAHSRAHTLPRLVKKIVASWPRAAHCCSVAIARNLELFRALPPPGASTAPRVMPPLFPECVGDTPSSQCALRQSTGATTSCARRAPFTRVPDTRHGRDLGMERVPGREGGRCFALSVELGRERTPELHIRRYDLSPEPERGRAAEKDPLLSR